jgi:hypothetical protein
MDRRNMKDNDVMSRVNEANITNVVEEKGKVAKGDDDDEESESKSSR